MNAGNALLKNLEEPPAATHFILVSHRPQRLPRTIVSRCRQLALRTPPRDIALAWLREQGIADGAVALAHASGAPLAAQAAVEGDDMSGRNTFLKRIAAASFDPLATAEAMRDLPLEPFIQWMQKWTYDLVAQRMLSHVRFNPDFEREIATLAARLDSLAALRLHRKLVRERRNVHHPLNGRLVMESVLLAYSGVVKPPVPTT